MTRSYLCYFLLLLVMMCQQKAIAQKQLASGFIVTNSGDTLHGKLQDKDWDISPENIKFKMVNEEEYKTYSAAEIKAFSVEHRDLYISQKVLMDMSPIRTENLLREDARPDTVTKQIFLKKLIDGRMSLYYHKDFISKPHFYIQKNDTALIELILKKYRSKLNEIMLREKFRGQLTFYMNDCPSVTEWIKKVSFSEDELSDLVTAYNQCFNQPSQVISAKSKSLRLRLGLAAGYFKSDITFSGAANSHGIQQIDFEPYNNFTLGLSLILRLQKRFERHHLVNEILWKDIKWNGTYQTYNNTNALSVYLREYTLNLSYIKLNTLYRYVFINNENTKFFFDVGVSNSFGLKAESTLYQEEEYAGNTYITQTTMEGLQRKYEQGLTIGTGIYYLDRYGIKISYERSNGMSYYSHLASIVDSYYIFINYTLGKRPQYQQTKD